MTVLKFPANFNNKLDCSYFTTFRVSDRYTVGTDVIIVCNNQFKFGTIIDRKRIRISDLTDWHCLIDSGKTREQTIALLKEYFDININTSFSSINYHLVKAKKDWMTLDQATPLFKFDDYD